MTVFIHLPTDTHLDYCNKAALSSFVKMLDLHMLLCFLGKYLGVMTSNISIITTNYNT